MNPLFNPLVSSRAQVRAYRGVWWALGFRRPAESEVVVVVADAAGPPAGPPAVSSPARQSLAGRKRLHRATRMLLSVLPRWVQGALGYPVSSSIGCSLSPGIDVYCTYLLKY